MSEIRHTKASLGRTTFIQRTLSQGQEDDAHYTPLQKCNKTVKELRQQIFRAEEDLANLNSEIESLRYNIPIKLKNLEKSNNKEILTQKDFLKNIQKKYEETFTTCQELSLEEQHLTEMIEELEIQNFSDLRQTETRNYNVFKKGQFQGYLDAEECEEIQEPCHWDEIGKLWSNIQEAEKELLKWQNIDCGCGEEYQRETRIKEEDMSEYLIRFIRDALFHFVMDQVSPKTKQEQLDLLISFFKFNDMEMESIKKTNGHSIRTQSVSW